MKFTSRKGTYIAVITFGFPIFIIIQLLVKLNENGDFSIFNLLSLVIKIAFATYIIYTYYNTEYTVNKTSFTYKSGFTSGTIAIHQITEIINGKTLSAGRKAATSLTNGLIIKFQNTKEVYISPETNESFIRKVLEINSDVKVTTL